MVVSIYNGGSPGVLYELLVACAWYALIAASLAELASSIPSSGGGAFLLCRASCWALTFHSTSVYHYATVTAGPKWGLTAGFFAGMLSWGGWMCVAVRVGRRDHS